MASIEAIEIERYDPATNDERGSYELAIEVEDLLHRVMVEYYQNRLGLPINTNLFNPVLLWAVVGQKNELCASGSLADNNGTVYWFARDRQRNGKLVGICKLSRWGEREVNLDEFDVAGPAADDVNDKGYRGRGIGRAMLVKAMSDPDIRPGDRLGLEVVCGNPTRNLYEALGFMPTGKAKYYSIASAHEPGQQPVMHQRMIAQVGLVRKSLGIEAHDLPRADSCEVFEQDSSLSSLADTLGEVALGCIPSAVAGINDRVQAIASRMACTRPDVESPGGQEESPGRMLQQAMYSLQTAAAILSEGSKSVAGLIGAYVGETGGTM